MTIEGVHTPEDIYAKFEEFYNRIVAKYNKVTHAFGDYRSIGRSTNLWTKQILATKSYSFKSARLYKRTDSRQNRIRFALNGTKQKIHIKKL